MSAEAEADRRGVIGRAAAVAPFVCVVAVLSFVLVFMVATSDVPPHGESFDIPEELGIPVTMAVIALLMTITAFVIPRVLLKLLNARFSGPYGQETYFNVLILLTSLMSTGTLVVGFAGAFMIGNLAYWAAIVLLGSVPFVLAWPTPRRRERLAANWNRPDDGGA